jgi:hypothetical protein
MRLLRLLRLVKVGGLVVCVCVAAVIGFARRGGAY